MLSILDIKIVLLYVFVMTRKKNPKNESDQYTVHASLSPQLGQVLCRTAKAEDRSVSSMVRVLLCEALKARGVEL